MVTGLLRSLLCDWRVKLKYSIIEYVQRDISTFFYNLDCPLESGPMSKKDSRKDSYQEKKAYRKNMANRMRKFTGVTERYDPNTNMKKFQNKSLFQ